MKERLLVAFSMVPGTGTLMGDVYCHVFRMGVFPLH